LEKIQITFFIILLLLANSIPNEADSYSEPSENEFSNEKVETIESFGQQTQDYLAKVPRAFTSNHGQLGNDEVRFYDQGGSVWFTADGVWFEIREELSIDSQESRVGSQESNEWLYSMRNPESRPRTDDWRPTTGEYKRVVLKQEFVDSNVVRPEGRGRLSWNSNFFYGKDPSKWCTSVPIYGQIYYENIYNGIDLKYYTFEGQLKYDLIVHPGADANQIRMRYNGAENLELTKLGNLKINTQIRPIIDGELYIYQENEGIRERVCGEFVLINNVEYGFRISGDYDPRKTLVIDPIVKYSTLIGGTGYSVGKDIARDSENNLYVTGYAATTGFPTNLYSYDASYNGNYDLIIFKMDPTCSKLLYSTYVGGSETEEGNAIEVDSDGNAYVTGYTISKNFPVTIDAFDPVNNATDYYDAFVLKINSIGSSLFYSTIIEGDDYDRAYDIVVDSSGNAIITGYTQSDNFPIKSAYDSTFEGTGDLFVLKLNSLGSDLIFSTYIGGVGDERGNCIALDSSSNIYVAGASSSTDFPISNNAYKKTIAGTADIFILKLKNQGDSIVYSTFINCSWNTENVVDIDVDNEGNSYIVGFTREPDFPVTPNAYKPPNMAPNSRNIFVTKLNTDGSNLIFSTLIGGTGDEMPRSLEVDSNKNIYVVGETGSSDFPVTSDALYKPINIYSTGFLFTLSSDGSELLYSTYVGGSRMDGTMGIVLDTDEEVYVMGITNSTDFPTTPEAYETSLDNDYKIYIMKILFKPFINITSTTFDINKTTMTAYSRGGIYNFKIKVFNTGPHMNLQTVGLNLDPTGHAIVLSWRHSNDTFFKISDPGDYVSIHPSSVAEYLDYHWELDFNVTFNWNYPDEKHHPVKASGTANSFSPFSKTSPLIYHVENDLYFQGSLVVKDSSNVTIEEDTLIRGGQNLTFSGLTSVYEDTIDRHPMRGSYRISVWDVTGVSWDDTPEAGEPCNLEISAPVETYSSGHTFTINHTGIPRSCDKTSQTFTLKIDGDNVTFEKPLPDDSTWQLTPEVIAKITIADSGGGKVDDTSIMRSISTDNGSTWSSWTDAEIIEENPDNSKIVTSTIELGQGRDNLIKWKALDSVGNGPAESDEYRIMVDSEPVVFSNIEPSEADIALTETVEIGITISDNTSGVSASTIRYSISTDGGETWSKWGSLENYQSGSIVKVKLNLTFPEGNSNRIRFRAGDIAGHITQSPEYAINVKTWDLLSYPVVDLISPLSGSVLYKNKLTLQWELLTLQYTDISYEIYFGETNPPTLYKKDVIDTLFILDDLDYNVSYYWEVIPKTGRLSGICLSGVWKFKIDYPYDPDWDFSSIIKIEGPDLVSIYQGEKKSIDLTLINYGSVPDNITVRVSDNDLTDHISLDNSLILSQGTDSKDQCSLLITIPKNFAVGKYDIPVIVRSAKNAGKIVARHTITVEVLKKDSGSSSFLDEKAIANIAILSTIIIIVIVIVLFLIRRSRKTRGLSDQRSDTNVAPSDGGPGSQPFEPFGNTPPDQLVEIEYDQHKKS
jgi:hypothetical protein